MVPRLIPCMLEMRDTVIGRSACSFSLLLLLNRHWKRHTGAQWSAKPRKKLDKVRSLPAGRYVSSAEAFASAIVVFTGVIVSKELTDAAAAAPAKARRRRPLWIAN